MEDSKIKKFETDLNKNIGEDAAIETSEQQEIFQPGQLQEPEQVFKQKSNNICEFKFGEMSFLFSSNDLNFQELYAYYLDMLNRIGYLKIAQQTEQDFKDMIDKNKPRGDYFG